MLPGARLLTLHTSGFLSSCDDEAIPGAISDAPAYVDI
jgi:hypothetical protein